MPPFPCRVKDACSCLTLHGSALMDFQQPAFVSVFVHASTSARNTHGCSDGDGLVRARVGKKKLADTILSAFKVRVVLKISCLFVLNQSRSRAHRENLSNVVGSGWIKVAG